MTLSRYSCALTDSVQDADDFVITINVGVLSFNVRFLWAIVTQQRYDELQRALKDKAQTDPLVNGGQLDRTYNWLNYYHTLINMTREEFITWYEEQQWLPNSWKGKPAEAVYIEIQDTSAEIEELYQQDLLYRESLVWQAEVSTENITTVTEVRLGGWNNFNTGMAFRFVAPGYEVIRKNDLQYVTMEFDINE